MPIKVNPSNVVCDHKTQTGYTSEVGNGKILGFSDVLNTIGNVAPTVHTDLMSASSIYFYNN